MNEPGQVRECPECGRNPSVEVGTMYCRFCGAQIVAAEDAVALWETVEPGITQDQS